MGVRWYLNGFCFKIFSVLMLMGVQSLNDEGVALLEFRSKINADPYGCFSNWNSNHSNPCMWRGVHCVNSKVQILNLKALSLKGTLAPNLGKLSHLQSLVLWKNHFSGTIPKELGLLGSLKLLDLRENNFTGSIPAEICMMLSLKYILLGNNNFDKDTLIELERSRMPLELQYDGVLASDVMNGPGCVGRKFGDCMSIREGNLGSMILPIKEALTTSLKALRMPPFNLRKKRLPNQQENINVYLPSLSKPHITQNLHNLLGRRRLLEQPKNLEAAAPVRQEPIVVTPIPIARSSGSFRAVPEPIKTPPNQASSADSPPKDDDSSNNQASEHPQTKSAPANWGIYLVIPIVVIIFIIAAIMVWKQKKRVVETIRPWKSGLSGQLQKAFVTGAPKLNRAELETACEDFSNIVDTINGCMIYKGTLSSGVEIAVSSTSIKAAKDWTKKSEMSYRKKIATLSRVNHKNFVNMLGYCEEEEPFTRMIVFEYAPNGTLFEHLHVKEVEHLDWTSRMRIIMGTAYCLQYMHHDLNPPVAHHNLTSSAIFLTDDFAAKVAEVSFGKTPGSPTPSPSVSGIMDSIPSDQLPTSIDPETNVYSFGTLLLEIISGKLLYSEEQGNLVNWAGQYLNDKRSISYMIDPTLNSFKDNELDIICEVIQDCIQSDPKLRPTMKDITSKLREVLSITPEQATPRLSPLWWAELEILSVEAT